MAKIRKLEISNFRAIAQLSWQPSPGVNCLIGPGDSGKSTILEAIDLCLGARRSYNFSDADFHKLDTDLPITVALTIGDLDDGAKSLDAYGQFLRGYDQTTGDVQDEPDSGLETVITLLLTVAADLDPQWTLYSDRAAAVGITRNLTWGDRQKMAPTRIGSYGDTHLAWRRGSILQRLADETVDISEALATVSRNARASFGDEADKQLEATLDVVSKSANAVGIDVGAGVKALLDVRAVSFVGGSVSVHDGMGVPLSGLGIGSMRMLITALQCEVASETGIVLLDELEHGLEPHRIIRLIGFLTNKSESPSQQAFVTTHSPVALREFSGDQLCVARKTPTEHIITQVGLADDMQGTIRKYPEAFLAPSVLVCEGASEVGFVRGIGRFLTEKGKPGIEARGVALVDGRGGGPDSLIKRAQVFHQLGYRAAVFMDSDVSPDATIEADFIRSGCEVIRWKDGFALEDALFHGLPAAAIDALVERAKELHGDEAVDAHITSKSGGKVKLADVDLEGLGSGYSDDTRALLGRASRTDGKRAQKGGWFKSIGYMEDVAFDIAMPSYTDWEDDFKTPMNSLLKWIAHGS